MKNIQILHVFLPTYLMHGKNMFSKVIITDHSRCYFKVKYTLTYPICNVNIDNWKEELIFQLSKYTNIKISLLDRKEQKNLELFDILHSILTAFVYQYMKEKNALKIRLYCSFMKSDSIIVAN